MIKSTISSFGSFRPAAVLPSIVVVPVHSIAASYLWQINDPVSILIRDVQNSYSSGISRSASTNSTPHVTLVFNTSQIPPRKVLTGTQKFRARVLCSSNGGSVSAELLAGSVTKPLGKIPLSAGIQQVVEWSWSSTDISNRDKVQIKIILDCTLPDGYYTIYAVDWLAQVNPDMEAIPGSSGTYTSESWTKISSACAHITSSTSSWNVGTSITLPVGRIFFVIGNRYTGAQRTVSSITHPALVSSSVSRVVISQKRVGTTDNYIAIEIWSGIVNTSSSGTLNVTFSGTVYFSGISTYSLPSNAQVLTTNYSDISSGSSISVSATDSRATHGIAGFFCTLNSANLTLTTSPWNDETDSRELNSAWDRQISSVEKGSISGQTVTASPTSGSLSHSVGVVALIQQVTESPGTGGTNFYIPSQTIGSSPEYPTPLTVFSIGSIDQLMSRLQEAKPGDHFVIENGSYTYNRPLIIGCVGTPQAPVVIRAKNPLQVAFNFGFEFLQKAANVFLYGIDFTGSPTSYLRGTNIVIRRCRIKPAPNFAGFSSGIRVEKGSNAVIDYCTISLYNLSEVSSNWPGKDWSVGAHYYGIYTNAEGQDKFSNLTIENSLFSGGVNRNSQPDKPYTAFVKTENNYSDHQAGLNWTIRSCRINSESGSSIIEFLNSRNRLEKVHVVGNNNGRIYCRITGYNSISQCRFESTTVELAGGRHIVDNSLATSWLVYAGTKVWDNTSSTSGIQASESIRLARCSGNVTVGYSPGSEYTVPANATSIEAHESGTVTLVSGKHTNTSQPSSSDIVDLNPVTVSETSVGASANWSGSGAGQQQQLPSSSSSEEYQTPVRLVEVSDASQLSSALSDALPGDHIVLNNGVYSGNFSVTKSGTSSNPIVIRAKNLLGASISGQISVSGSYCTLWGMEFRQNSSCIISGQKDVVRRCKFSIGPSNDKYATALYITGQDIEVSYCEFANIYGQALGVQPASGARRVTIRRCYFHDNHTPDPSTALYLGSHDGDEPIEAFCLVEYNLFERCPQRYGETLCNKSSVNTLRFNTLLDCQGGRIVNRTGHGGIISGNWVEDSTGGGIGIIDRDVTVLGNRLVGSSLAFEVFAGNRNPDDPVGSPPRYYPAAWNTILAGNTGNLTIGRFYSSVTPEMNINAKNTIVEAHNGTISYSRHENTTVSPTTSRTIPQAFKLSSNQVGPLADWSGQSNVSASAPVSSPAGLPTPVRVITVSNGSELINAVSSAVPGDHIVLNDGSYVLSGKLNISRSGNSSNPIVIRAKNVLQAKIPTGFDIQSGTSHVWIWGIDFKDAVGCMFRGNFNKLLRCRFWPKPAYQANGWSAAVTPYDGSDGEISYCELRLHTREEAQAESSSLWGSNTVYGVVWSYFSSAPQTPFYRLLISKCHLVGGPKDTPYSNPNCQFIEAGGSPTTAYNTNCEWTIQDCYGDVPRNVTILDFKVSGFKLLRSHIITPGGGIQLREGKQHRIDRCTLSGAYVEICRDQHVISNTSTSTIAVMAGQVAYNDTTQNPAAHGQAHQTVIANCSASSLVIGKSYGSGYSYPASQTTVEQFSGSISYGNHSGTVVRQTVQTPGIQVSNPVTLSASQVGPFADLQSSTQPPSSSQQPSGSATGELPNPLRTITVANYSQLNSALSTAQPGDHIILEDGTYSGTLNINVSGTSTNPIVIRARNVLGARISSGFFFSSSTSNVWLWGIDFKDSATCVLSGTNHVIRRCRFWPLPNFTSDVRAIQPSNGSSCRIDYSEIRLYTLGEISSMFPGRDWNNNVTYSGISGNTSYSGNNRFNKLTVERCLFRGGINRTNYSQPYTSLFSNAGGVQEDMQQGYRHEWVVRLCRVESDSATNILNHNNSGNLFDRVHVVGNGGGVVKFRYTGYCKMERCRLENCETEIMGGHHVIENSIITVGSWRIFAGTYAWNDASNAALNGYPQAYQVRLSRCAGSVVVGNNWGDAHTFPADGTRIEAHRSGTVTLVSGRQTNTVQTQDTSTPDLQPITLSSSEVGTSASWVGIT